MKLDRYNLMQAAGLNPSTEVLNEDFIRTGTASDVASELLSLLAHPDMKRGMDALSDRLDDAQFMAVKKLYDALYAELKKHE